MILCFATHNRYKLLEITQLVKRDISLLSLDDIGCTEDLPEIHPTLQENSYSKAEYVYRKYHVNCFADDTGLEVEALGGAPGVLSARYAGPGKNSSDNIRLLLRNLQEHHNRSARFRTVITLFLDHKDYTFEGIVEGTITEIKRGVHGFGYDPVFLPSGHEITLAEMPLSEKNAISHRAIAIRKLVDFLNAYKLGRKTNE